MAHLNGRTRVYLVTFWAAAAIALIAAARSAAFPFWTMVIYGCLLVIFVLADMNEFRFESEDGSRIMMTITDAPIIFMLISFDVGSVFVIFFGSLISDYLHKREFHKNLFNASERVVAYAILSFILHHPLFASYVDLRNPFSLATFLLLSVLYYLINMVFVATVMALSTRQSLLRVYRESAQGVGWVHFATTPFGALMAVLWQYNPWLLPLCIMPIVMFQRWFKTVEDLQVANRTSRTLAAQSEDLAGRLERLQLASTAMLASRDPLIILDTMCERLGAMLDARARYAVLLDEKPPQMIAATGLPDGWAWDVDAYSRALAVPVVRVLTADEIQRMHPGTNVPWSAMIIVPLGIDPRQRIGGIFLALDSEPHLSEKDHRILLAFAHQASLAIENVRLIAELRTKHEELLRSSKLAALGTFAAGIGHEFNNMLAGIMGHAQLGLLTDSVSEKNDSLEVAVKMSKHGRSITNGLLTFARHRASQRAPFSLQTVVDETLAMVERELGKENVRVERLLQPIPSLLGDAGQLAQVVLNLVTNARDAMRDNSGGTITISLRQVGSNAELRVSDTGCGIPDHLLDQIFQPFVTTKGPLHGSSTPGTGLGLAITHGIVESHGGSIHVESAVGVGTTMILRLPISRSAAAISASPAPREKLPAMRILLVEDEAEVASSIARLLEHHGQSVSIASDGDSALRQYAAHHFNLVISDIVMPGMTGTEFIRRIHDIDPDVPILAITGQASAQQLDPLHDLGLRVVLRKPFEVDELLAAIGRTTRIHQLRVPSH